MPRAPHSISLEAGLDQPGSASGSTSPVRRCLLSTQRWVLRHVLQDLKPYTRGITISLVAGLAMVATSLAVPPLTGAAVDAAESKDLRRVGVLAAVLLVVGVVEAVLVFIRRYTASGYAIRVEQDLRRKAFHHLQRLPLHVHDSMPSGQVISRLVGDLSQLRRFLAFAGPSLLLNALQFLGALILMLRLHPLLTLLTVVLYLPTVYASIAFMRTYKAQARLVRDRNGDVATSVEQSVAGIRIIKSLGRGPHVTALFTGRADDLRAASITAVRTRAGFWTTLSLVPNLNLAVVASAGAYGVSQGQLTVGEVGAFLTALLMLSGPLAMFGANLAAAEEANAAYTRVVELLETPREILESEHAVVLEPGQPADVVLEDVWFRYAESDQWVLRGVDLTVRAGETVAIVGATGSGKTTLAMLIPRLYDVTTGTVRLAGVDVRELSAHSLARTVAVALEEATLFSRSVRDNVVLGRPDATETEVEAALRAGGAEFVHDLPQGLDTRIGEQGVSLSGGQRQRVALARAVLARPAVLVLDDPLSAVDVTTEARVHAALHEVLENVTTLIVAHRPSTLVLADRVAWIEDGRVRAYGRHEQLLADPDYRALLSAAHPELVP
jgi:ATP-binding cassette subfamily B protein